MGKPLTGEHKTFPACPRCGDFNYFLATMCKHCGAATVRKHGERLIRAASIWAGMAAAMQAGYRLGHSDGAIQVMARDMAEVVGQPLVVPAKGGTDAQ